MNASRVRPAIARFWSGSIVDADAGSFWYFTEGDSLPASSGDGTGVQRIWLHNLTDKQARIILTLAGPVAPNQGIATSLMVRLENIGSEPMEFEAPEGHHFVNYLATFYLDDADSTPDTAAGSVTVRAFQYRTSERGV